MPRTVVGPMRCPSLPPGELSKQCADSIHGSGNTASGGWSGNEVNRRTPRGFARCRHDVFGTPKRLAAQHASAQRSTLVPIPGGRRK